MNKNWKIRPLLWSALIFSLIGVLIGGVLAFVAVNNLSKASQSIIQFEENWSNAHVYTKLARVSAANYVKYGNKEDFTNFEKYEALNKSNIKKLFNDIHDIPDGYRILKSVDSLNLKVHGSEWSAVMLKYYDRPKEAEAKLNSKSYIDNAKKLDDIGTNTEKQILLLLKGYINRTFQLIIFGIAGMFIGLIFAAICWWQVGRLFQHQANELMVARDTLAAHANSLEQRIELRTKDLKAAKLAAEDADKAKSAFLAQMSHEIRTPMNGVLGMAAILAKTNLDEKQKKLLSIIQESGDTLLDLLNDVLDLAKIEAGRLSIEAVDFNLSDIARSAKAIFSGKAYEKNINLSVSFDENSNIWCKGDPTRLKQILFNLISNAVKFTSQGFVKVKVSSELLADKKVSVTFNVEDTGIGINKEAQKLLFKTFYQADTSTTRKYGGSGLGLSICKQLANKMGGDIYFESEENKGSIFTFHIILDEGEVLKSEIDTFEKPLISELTNDGNLKILAAEDNKNNRLVIKMFLEQVGITPIFAENGAIAVELWQNQHFDLILMDVQMPIMNGPEATRRIRELEAQTHRERTPIIALTANAMTHHIKECIEAGMDAHVSKPIRPDILFSTIDKVLNIEDNDAANNNHESREVAV